MVIAAEGVSLGLANQAQSAVAIGECHDGLGGPGETCGLGAVETVGGLLRLAHEDVGGHPFVARSVRQSEGLVKPVRRGGGVPEVVGSP